MVFLAILGIGALADLVFAPYWSSSLDCSPTLVVSSRLANGKRDLFCWGREEERLC
jgi:hypothetical protein